MPHPAPRTFFDDAIGIVSPPVAATRVIRLYNRDWTRCLEIPDSDEACKALDEARRSGCATSISYCPATTVVRGGLTAEHGDLAEAVAFIHADFAEHVAEVRASRTAAAAPAQRVAA